MRDTLSDAREDSTRVVLVGGEAGIGKTRLIDEFIAAVPSDTLVARGQCVDLDSDAPPYGPLATVLRQLLSAPKLSAQKPSAPETGVPEADQLIGPSSRDALRILLPELAGAAGEARADDDNQGGRGRLFDAIATLIESVTKSRTLVIVVEDLHWCDQATLGVLRFLVKILETRGLLFVFTFRSDELARGHPLRSWLPELDRSRRVARIELERLSRRQVARMLACAWDAPAAKADIDAVFSRSDGVPFFVEELANLGKGAALSMQMPTTLRGVLLARYDALAEQTQQVMRAIAAGGQRVGHDLLARAMSTDNVGRLEDAVREAIAADVLVADDTTYAFRHALMQEAIHDQLLPGERVRLHTAYAEAMSEAGQKASVDAGATSYHWMAAHNLPNAFAASIEAMAQARASYAHSAGARMGERAIALWDRVPDAQAVAGRSRVELLSDTAYMLRNAGESTRALALIDEALTEDTGDDPALRARMLRNKASFLANDGRTGSIELLEQALAAIPDPEPSVLRANVLGELAARLMLVARFSEAVEVADHAYAEAVAVGSDTRRSVALNIRGVSRVSLGEIEPGLADLARAGELAQNTTDSALVRYWVNQSDVLNLLGRYEDAIATAETGLAIARERMVERTSGAMLTFNLISPLLALGQAERARELLDRALELDPPIGFSAPLQRLALHMAVLDGDPTGADELLRGWRGGLDRQGRIDTQSELNLAFVAAEIALELGDPARAWTEASVLLAAGHRQEPAFDLPLAAMAARAVSAAAVAGISLPAGDDGTSMTHADAVGRVREVLDAASWWPTAAAYEAQFAAEIGGHAMSGNDPALWRKALDAAEGPESVAQLWPYAAYRLARASAEAGDRTAAEKWARATRDKAEQIGALLYVRRSDDLLKNAGLTPRGAPVGAPSSIRMTERESQVLELLAQGLSNREIAARLFISTKTASVHVSNILRKTGASSRTEAAYLSRMRQNGKH
jgi:DNA-binding CsgD family transcriptional regulator/tetratricopeptide (TPR) repeat protein